MVVVNPLAAVNTQYQTGSTFAFYVILGYNTSQPPVPILSLFCGAVSPKATKKIGQRLKTQLVRDCKLCYKCY